MADGNKTSENKMAWVMMAVNLVLALAGILTTMATGTPWAVLVVGVVAAANAYKSGKYSESRGTVKAHEALAKANPTPPA